MATNMKSLIKADRCFRELVADATSKNTVDINVTEKKIWTWKLFLHRDDDYDEDGDDDEYDNNNKRLYIVKLTIYLHQLPSCISTSAPHKGLYIVVFD
jgi:hypothetical protein